MNILNSFAKFKTIASQSIFGVGDIPVLTSGDLSAGLSTKADLLHTHSQSDITNLVTDLAGKQATLVSGVSIKTINGNSVLGSGDIVLSSSMNIDGGNASSIGILMGIDGEGA